MDNLHIEKSYVQKGFFNDIFEGIINCFNSIGDKISRMVRNVVNWTKTVVKKTTMWIQGIEKYEIVFSGGDNACETCREMAGKVFPRSELNISETAPPFHPNCRCKIIPYVEINTEAESVKERQETEQGKPSPTKAEIHCSNRYLTMEEMQVNAKYIYNYLIAQGWTKNAISALLGNMQKESYINPGLWENKKENNMKRGFGLVQWTPATKFINWAKKNGLDYRDIDSQLQRILLEVKATNGSSEFYQWQRVKHSSRMSFQEFTQSNLDPMKLAEIFLLCYESPAVQDKTEISERAKNAMNWHKFLNLQINSKCFQNFQYMI